ncbi:MAG: hypothetical protein IJ113_06065 [Eggerthellaceae bacterium]|nr:hypothetical protein [Eggerthellaceae bacterium]
MTKWVHTYTGTVLYGQSTTPLIWEKSGIKKAKVGETYFSKKMGHVYECRVAGGPKVAKWAWIGRDPVYFGTAITGTNTNPRGFKYSGLKNPEPMKDQMYQNSETGHVYQCTKGGQPTVAEWKYVRTDIVKKPQKGVSLGAPVRSGNGSKVFTCEWKTPDSLKSDKSGDRIQGFYVNWIIGIPGTDAKECMKSGNSGLTKDSVNLNNFVYGEKKDARTGVVTKLTYTRADFYPVNKKRKLSYLICDVQPYNQKGKGAEKARKQYTFSVPKAPGLSAPTIDKNTGRISCVCNSDAGHDSKERYDTVYSIHIENTYTKKKWYHRKAETTSSTQFTMTYDPPDYQAIGYADYIKVTFTAYNRGYAGDSKTVEKVFYCAFPAQATIKSTEVSSRSSDGKCTVKISLPASKNKEHPVSSVRLDYLANVEYSSADRIPGDVEFRESNIVDNAGCTALTIPTNVLIPDPGRYSYVRVRTLGTSPEILFRDSKAFRVKGLETPAETAADDEIIISSATRGDDGTSAKVLLAWGKGGQDDAESTELSWADSEDAWTSTEAPNTYDFEWSDTTSQVSGYSSSALVTIKKLDEDKTVYVRARRYNEDAANPWGPYTNIVPIKPFVLPTSVTASAPAFIPIGESLPVSWIVGGTATQKSWKLLTSTGVTVATGDNSLNAYYIPSNRIAGLVQNSEITLHVEVSAGGDWIASNDVTTSIIEPPTCEISMQDTLAAQPLSFNVSSNTEASLIVIVTSDGNDWQLPTGMYHQPAGDTVWSSLIEDVVWVEDEGVYHTTITAPTGLELMDTGRYSVSVTALDNTSGLKSDTAVASFAIHWEHQAVSPEDYVEIEGNDYTDEDGIHHQNATITLTNPVNSGENDVYDIYRMTGDGAVLVGSNYPLDYEIVDEFAPFGDGSLKYRISLRTPDGDIEYCDFDYTLTGKAMRFDWNGGVLELPYDISVADSYEKDADTHKHLDGTVTAGWNQGVIRKASLSSDVIRLENKDTVAAARALGRYAGIVFVRTPDGSAYAANVEVTDMSTEGIIQAVAISAEEVDLTDQFMLMPPGTDEPQTEEEAEEDDE